MLAVDAIFFDLDGTLVDARKDIANAMNYTLSRLGYEEKGFDEIISYVGTGVSYLISKSMGTADAKLVDEGVRIYEERYTRHPADEASLYPHALDILGYFRSKRKFVLTNRYVRLTEPVLKKMGIRGYFEDVIGGDDENCLKPSACVLDNALNKYKVDKARAIIVGDMAVDIMAGKNSGVATCWVTYGLGKPADLEGIRPDYTVDDLAELKKIIK